MFKYNLKEKGKRMLGMDKKEQERVDEVYAKDVKEEASKQANVIREERIAEADTMDGDYKDELIVIILLAPILITFVNALFTGGMDAAWKSMVAAPEWYQSLLAAVVLVVFGLKSVVISIVDHVIKVREFKEGMNAEDEDVRDRALMKLLDAQLEK